LAVGLATAAFAQVEVSPDLRDLQHSRNVAMGGAYESLGYGAEAVGGNPAALSVYKRYAMEATGAWDVPQGYGFGSVALADSTTEVAAGLSYHFATYGGSERRWAHLTTLALSYPLGEHVHLGLAARHHVVVGASNTNAISMNAGLVFHPTQWLTLGVSGHNLISVYNRDIPRYFVASASALIAGQLTPAFDLRVDLNEPTPRFVYSGGLEWLIGQSFPLRAGYQYDGISGHHYVSAGLGYFSEGSGVDVAYRHELFGAQEGRMISLTAKLQL
jgi:hypothetical protein